MFCILEGCDGAGKTTLAEHLQKVVGDEASVAHLGPPKSPETALDECLAEPYGSYDPTANDRDWETILHGSTRRMRVSEMQTQSLRRCADLSAQVAFCRHSRLPIRCSRGSMRGIRPASFHRGRFPGDYFWSVVPISHCLRYTLSILRILPAICGSRSDSLDDGWIFARLPLSLDRITAKMH